MCDEGLSVNYRKKVSSPLGTLTLVATDTHLISVTWEEDSHLRVPLPKEIDDQDTELLILASVQLSEYFRGERYLFSLPLLPCGTSFQRSVWSALTTIPYGTTWSYAALAGVVGSPRASRAVGLANSKNPLSIVIPCHRIIGKNGTLTGFAGGLEAKRFLLDLEQSRRLAAPAESIAG
jgi:methylated-DNA-[protein]-cysteine S-methyltransferase